MATVNDPKFQAEMIAKLDDAAALGGDFLAGGGSPTRQITDPIARRNAKISREDAVRDGDALRCRPHGTDISRSVCRLCATPATPARVPADYVAARDLFVRDRVASGYSPHEAETAWDLDGRVDWKRARERDDATPAHPGDRVECADCLIVFANIARLDEHDCKAPRELAATEQVCNDCATVFDVRDVRLALLGTLADSELSLCVACVTKSRRPS
jgi:hypothetical protein